MKKDLYTYPKSSFLGMPKDANLIMKKILSNRNILKLLEYGVKDWEDRPDVTNEMIEEMFDSKQISSVPNVKIDQPEKTYLRLSYGTTVRNSTNPEFRDNTFGIDIICHYDNWDLGDYELRPYRIAGEIDSMLDGFHLTGIGELEFISAVPYIYDQEFAGLTLTYLAIRGNEDRVNPLD